MVRNFYYLHQTARSKLELTAELKDKNNNIKQITSVIGSKYVVQLMETRYLVLPDLGNLGK